MKTQPYFVLNKKIASIVQLVKITDVILTMQYNVSIPDNKLTLPDKKQF